METILDEQYRALLYLSIDAVLVVDGRRPTPSRTPARIPTPASARPGSSGDVLRFDVHLQGEGETAFFKL